MSKTTPSPKGENGRGANGRFVKGWRGGPGNPHAKKVGRLRSALLAAVNPCDIKGVVAKLIELAKAGDVAAARLLFDRLFGPAATIDMEGRMTEIEQQILERKGIQDEEPTTTT